MAAREGSSPRRWLGFIALTVLAGSAYLALRGARERGALAPLAPSDTEPTAGQASAPPPVPDAARVAERAAVAVPPRARAALDGIAYASEDPLDDRPGSPLRGVTRDEAGRPLAGVRVVFHPPDLGEWWGEARALRREAVSAQDGSFVVDAFPNALTAQPPRAERAGFALLSASPYARGQDGGWEPLELVLGPSATLEVTLVDAREVPLEGRWVAARPARAKHIGLRTVPLAEHHGVTDADGRVALELPADSPLAVTCEVSEPGRSFERCDGDRLSSTDEDGAPLLLAPGELRRVVLAVGSTLHLEGRVVGPERLPVAGARVRVLEGEPDDSGWFGSLLDATADAQGEFRVTLHDLAREDVLTVLAGDGQWIAFQGAGLHSAARRRVEVGAWLDAPAPLELVLEPLLSIQGRVEDERGAPVSAVVWAVPASAPYVLQKGPLGFLPISANRSTDGSFEVPALRPGRHDVIVKRNEPRTYHRFPDVEAGARGVVLVIEEDRVMHLRLVVEGAAPGATLQPVVLWHQPRDPARFGRAHTSAVSRIEGCDEPRWPARELPAPSRPGGHSGNVEHAEGRTIVLLEEAGGAVERALEPRQAGCFSIGLRGWDAEGRPYARRLTPPLRLSAGAWTFVVPVELAATVAGRVPAGARDGLCVELRDAAGQPVFDAQGERWTAIAADGTFRLEQVTPGALELRAGARRELEAGRWRFRERLTAPPGVETSVQLHE